jgi:hypothetical protein
MELVGFREGPPQALGEERATVVLPLPDTPITRMAFTMGADSIVRV